MMWIYLIRHGHSQWQLRRGGEWDSGLSEIGRRQADCVAHFVCGLGVGSSPIRTSPLKRALETAEHTVRLSRREIVVQETLREANFRVADYLPGPEEDRDSQVGGVQMLSPVYAMFEAQAKRALRELAEAAGNGTPVVAFSHGGLIKTILRLILDSPASDFRLYNAGVTTIAWELGEWRVAMLNQVAYLPERLRTM